jgi:hypothetical protein
MEYASSDPSVVRSIRQRVLLNAWLRALHKPAPLPVLSDFDPETGLDEVADMMGFDVLGDGEAARFLITGRRPTLHDLRQRAQASDLHDYDDQGPRRQGRFL